jgi:hypothetical protein
MECCPGPKAVGRGSTWRKYGFRPGPISSSHVCAFFCPSFASSCCSACPAFSSSSSTPSTSNHGPSSTDCSFRPGGAFGPVNAIVFPAFKLRPPANVKVKQVVIDDLGVLRVSLVGNDFLFHGIDDLVP